MDLLVYGVIGLVVLYVLFRFSRLAKVVRERGGLQSRQQAIDAFQQQYLADQHEVADQAPHPEPDKPMTYGRFPEWVAVKSTDPEAVAKALGITDGKPCNWESGTAITSSHANRRTWVSGEAMGWVFVRAPFSMPEMDNPDKGLLNLLRVLSRSFGEAQYYAFYGSVMVNAWAKAVDGEIVRAYYVWANENKLIWNTGAITPGEREADIVFGESGFRGELPVPEGLTEDPHANNPDVCLYEDGINAIAEKWSVDPTGLGGQDLPMSTGVIGQANIEGIETVPETAQ